MFYKGDLRKRLQTSVLYYDVDTQNDFMYADSGSLPVPEAEKIISNLEKLTNFARRDKFGTISGSVDRHFKGDAELEENGGPFPEHCMDGHYGQEKIPETMPVCPAYIPNERMRFNKLEQIVGDKREIFFEKQHYDVFTNPNAEKVFENIGYAVVYGVATDYCVKAAVLGMRELGIDVFVVKDAIAGIDPEGCEKAINEMKDAGAYMVTTEDILKGVVQNKMNADWGGFA